MALSLNPFRRGTQLNYLAELLLEGKSREEIFRDIFPLVMSQKEPFIFSDNVNGSRIPKPVYDQIPLAFYAIGRARNMLIEKNPAAAQCVATEDSFTASHYNDKRWRAQLFQTVRAEYEAGSLNSEPTVSEPEPEPTPITETDTRSKIEYLYRRLNEIRNLVQSKRVNNREFDFISTRAFVHGADAVIAGIEPDDFLVSIGASWNPETRKEAGIRDSVDYRRYAIPDTPLIMGFVIKLIEAGIPVYLYGPTGSGKSYLARLIADHLGKDYGEIPLSCGVSRTDLFGSWNAKGFVSRPLTRIYGNGGIYCLEEIDGADPNILLSVNNLVANDFLFNTSNGETIERHPDFIPIATANTLGNGATSNYSAREGLDGSTLDRFKYGRVFVDYDPHTERGIIDAKIASL